MVLLSFPPELFPRWPLIASLRVRLRRTMPFALGVFFMTDLPGDTPGSVPAIALGVGARAAFLAKSLVVLLADGKSLPIRVADAIHGSKTIL